MMRRSPVFAAALSAVAFGPLAGQGSPFGTTAPCTVPEPLDSEQTHAERLLAGEIDVPYLVNRCGLAYEYKEGFRAGCRSEVAKNPVYYRTGDPQIDNVSRSEHGLAHDAWQQGFRDARKALRLASSAQAVQ